MTKYFKENPQDNAPDFVEYEYQIENIKTEHICPIFNAKKFRDGKGCFYDAYRYERIETGYYAYPIAIKK